MKKSLIKKLVSIITCISILGGVAATSNAYSINSGSSAEIKTHNDSPYDYWTYIYDVSYVHFDGMAVGAFTSGLTVKVNSYYVCTVNTAHKKGPFYNPSSGTNSYKLHNNSSKHVAINMTLTIDEYY